MKKFFEFFFFSLLQTATTVISEIWIEPDDLTITPSFSLRISETMQSETF